MARKKAGAQTEKDSNDNTTPPPIPLALPSRTPLSPTHETLLEIAEKQQLFQRAAAHPSSKSSSSSAKSPSNSSNPSSARSGTENEDDDDPLIGRFAESILWSISLTMIHFTLDVLVQHQYAVALEFRPLITRSLTAFPAFWLFLYMLHPHPAPSFLVPSFPSPPPSSSSSSNTPNNSSSKKDGNEGNGIEGNERYWKLMHWAHQSIFFAGSTAAGAYLARITNLYGYYAVMKQAPPVGVLWIWAVVELDLGWAVASLLATGGYMWWNGYGYW